MKRIISMVFVVICVTNMFVSWYSLLVSATPKSEYDRLWEEKMQADDEWNRSMGWGERSTYFYPFFSEFNWLLLYTDIAKDLTLKRYSDLHTIIDMFPVNLPTSYVIFGLYNDYLVCPDFEKITQDRCYGERGEQLPTTYVLVQEYGIKKEELLAAYEKSKNDPESIRPYLDRVSDEEFDDLMKSLKRFHEKNKIPDYYFDALYLEDENQVKLLLSRWYTTVIDGRVVTSYDLFDACEYTFEELKAMGILTKEFRYFWRNCFEEYEDQIKVYSPADVMVKQVDDYLAENPENDPPKTGDPTAAYALIFTLAALPLVGFGVAEWKKRRRAV